MRQVSCELSYIRIPPNSTGSRLWWFAVFLWLCGMLMIGAATGILLGFPEQLVAAPPTAAQPPADAASAVPGGDGDGGGGGEMAAAFRRTAAACARRHTVDVETFRGETADAALMAAAAERQSGCDDDAGGDYVGGLASRLYARVTRQPSPCGTARRRRSTKTVDRHRGADELDRRWRRTSSTTSGSVAGSVRRRRERQQVRGAPVGNSSVDTSQPIVYPTTPEMILEYHKVHITPIHTHTHTHAHTPV